MPFHIFKPQRDRILRENIQEKYSSLLFNWERFLTYPSQKLKDQADKINM